MTILRCDKCQDIGGYTAATVDGKHGRFCPRCIRGDGRPIHHWWVVYDTRTKAINSIFGVALERQARDRLAECQVLAKTDDRTLSGPSLAAPPLYRGRDFALGKLQLPYPERPSTGAPYEGEPVSG